MRRQAKMVVLSILFVSAPLGPDARAACALAELCPSLDTTAICAAEATCFEQWNDCAFACLPPGPDVESCLAQCQTGFVTCGTAQYAAGAACYPCAFDVSLCPQQCSNLPAVAGIEERWQASPLQLYTPMGGDTLVLIPGDAGKWFVGDTVSNFPECGPTGNRAQVASAAQGSELRLLSDFNEEDCSNNMWVDLHPNLPGHNAYQLPLGPGTQILFRETGAFDDPLEGGRVTLELRDDRGNEVHYVLQRDPTDVPSTRLPIRREIFLDPNAGTYERDLFADFSTVPDFSPHACRRITSIAFAIDEAGSASLADLVIAAPESSGPWPALAAAAILSSLRARRASRRRLSSSMRRRPLSPLS